MTRKNKPVDLVNYFDPDNDWIFEYDEIIELNRDNLLNDIIENEDNSWRPIDERQQRIDLLRESLLIPQPKFKVGDVVKYIIYKNKIQDYLYHPINKKYYYRFLGKDLGFLIAENELEISRDEK